MRQKALTTRGCALCPMPCLGLVALVASSLAPAQERQAGRQADRQTDRGRDRQRDRDRQGQRRWPALWCLLLYNPSLPSLIMWSSFAHHLLRCVMICCPACCAVAWLRLQRAGLFMETLMRGFYVTLGACTLREEAVLSSRIIGTIPPHTPVEVKATCVNSIAHTRMLCRGSNDAHKGGAGGHAITTNTGGATWPRGWASLHGSDGRKLFRAETAGEAKHRERDEKAAFTFEEANWERAQRQIQVRLYCTIAHARILDLVVAVHASILLCVEREGNLCISVTRHTICAIPMTTLMHCTTAGLSILCCRWNRRSWRARPRLSMVRDSWRRPRWATPRQ